MSTLTVLHEAPSPASTVASPSLFKTGIPSSRTEPPLSLAVIPDAILNVEYAVRGQVFIRAMEVEKNLAAYPFDQLVPCHIGNPHAVGVRGLTYVREVISLLAYPNLNEKTPEDFEGLYARDSVERAQKYLKFLGDAGAYTHSQGALGIRKEVADFLEARDGGRPTEGSIYMTGGASDGINTLLECIVRGPTDGVLLPKPQYPLYAATVTKLNGAACYYEMDEDNGWALDLDTLKQSILTARENGIDPKVLVVISPGNPVPCMLNYEDYDAILRLCEKEKILVIADEVYQANVYGKNRFVSARSVLLKEGLKTQLASFHSCSKGLAGECGLRGGFMQVENVDVQTSLILYKMRSVSLCSSTHGQACMGAILTPPKEGEQSYATYVAEREKLMDEYREKARMATEFFNSLPGMSCQPINGGMYAFPKFEVSDSMIEEASARGLDVDSHYCLELLEATGIITTPGSGFGEKEGTHHFRVTILPRIDIYRDCLKRFAEFHLAFWQRHNPSN